MSDMPPPPPMPQGPSDLPATPRPAELLDRFVARLLDGIILAIVNGIVVGTIVVGVIMGSSGGIFVTGTNYAAAAVSAILTSAIYLGYFAWMESSQGRTLGKMVMKLRTVGPDGANPTLEQAVRRNIWVAFGILGIVPVVGSLVGSLAELAAAITIAVGINNDTFTRRGWHDTFAGGTRVVKEG